MGRQPDGKRQLPVLNMLNMKYVILPDQNDRRQNTAIQNPFAMGNCWLVKEVRFVKNADEEMNALNSFDPAQVAFVDERFKQPFPLHRYMILPLTLNWQPIIPTK